MLSYKSRQHLSGWWHSGKSHISELLAIKKLNDQHNLIGLVINPQYMKLLKINHIDNQYEVDYFNIVKLPEGLLVNNEIKDSVAMASILKDIFNKSEIKTKNVAFTIPRSSAIVKTISVDGRLHPDEIESRVWLEANRLFPNLIGDIYLDFAVNGPSMQDPTQVEILIVACRKEQIKPYLDVMKLAGLNAKVVDINYYAYERSLSLIMKQSPQIKSVALLNISYRLIDLLVIEDGKLIYTHELSYDGHNLLQLSTDNEDNLNSSVKKEAKKIALTPVQSSEILKNTLGLHLKHALQFFYSSRPNTRVEQIILSGDTVAAIPGVVDYVRQEVGKEIVVADPFKNMNLSANVDKATLVHYASALVLCCGLALTKII